MQLQLHFQQRSDAAAGASRPRPPLKASAHISPLLPATRTKKQINQRAALRARRGGRPNMRLRCPLSQCVPVAQRCPQFHAALACMGGGPAHPEHAQALSSACGDDARGVALGKNDRGAGQSSQIPATEARTQQCVTRHAARQVGWGWHGCAIHPVRRTQV